MGGKSRASTQEIGMRMLASLALALAVAGTASAEGFTWIENDYDKALAEAKATGKLLHVNFWAEW